LKFAPFILLGLIAFQSCLILDGSFHEKSIDALSLSTTDNPSLRKDYVATILSSTRTIQLRVPDYVDASALVPTIDYRGLTL